MRRAVKCLGRNNHYNSERSCLKDGVIKPDDTRECLLPQCKLDCMSRFILRNAQPTFLRYMIFMCLAVIFICLRCP